jgi:rhodanese-related sulfurtransferase
MCYAPQFDSAKDPINFAGMIAANFLNGDSPVTHWKGLDKTHYYLLDVREPLEFESGHAEGAVNIPLHTLRSRLNDLPRNKEIAVYCGVGQRSYYATRLFKQNGFSVWNISGGITSFKQQSQVREK